MVVLFTSGAWNTVGENREKEVIKETLVREGVGVKDEGQGDISEEFADRNVRRKKNALSGR